MTDKNWLTELVKDKKCCVCGKPLTEHNAGQWEIAEGGRFWCKKCAPRIGFTCQQCGYKGDATELEEKHEGSSTLVCPVCRTADWWWD
jgi:hypothetical protein